MMKNLKKLISTFALLSLVFGANAQKSPSSNYLPNRIKEIEQSKDKISYLHTYLKELKGNPKAFEGTTSEKRDSVSDKMQLDLQVFNFSIFASGKDQKQSKSQINISASLKKAFAKAIQMVNENVYNKARQAELEKHLEKVNALIIEYNFLKTNG